MAEILPFPLARRRDYVRRQAAWFLKQDERAGERNLQHQLDVQRQTMRRRGVSPDAIEREIGALEGVIRAEVWRRVLAPEVG